MYTRFGSFATNAIAGLTPHTLLQKIQTPAKDDQLLRDEKALRHLQALRARQVCS